MTFQALLQRKPGTTEKEFSDHWYNTHAQLIIPLFQYCGVKTYIQIHPLLTTPSSINCKEWSGAAEIHITSMLQSVLSAPESGDLPKWVVRYHQEVIVADEKKFLVGEAMGHVMEVAPGTVFGDRKAIIEDGKVQIEVGEDVWRLWRAYEEEVVMVNYKMRKIN